MAIWVSVYDAYLHYIYYDWKPELNDSNLDPKLSSKLKILIISNRIGESAINIKLIETKYLNLEWLRMQHVFPDFEEFDNASVRKYKRAIQWS